MTEACRGYAFGLAATAIWGFFPLYFRLLRPSSPLEVLAHRVVWSIVFVALLLTVLRGWRPLGSLVRRRGTAAGLSLAGVLIGVNWGVYIYGVNSDRVVEAALGYFITPLVSVVLGVTILRERLRATQWVAVGIGAAAVVVLTVDYGRPPWLALTLASTFAAYGLVKKRLAVPPAQGLLVESAVLVLPALGFLAWLAAAGRPTVGQVSVPHTALVLLSGAATAVPLLLFAAAANRVPLVTVGVMQYVTPTLQLACGVLVLHEPLPPARLAGFVLVWLALAAFTADAVRGAAPARPPGRATARRR